MRPRPLLTKLALMLLGGCAFHASCNAGGLDMTKAKGFVSDIVEKYTSVKPSKVDCPDHVATEKDATFACTFEDGGVSGRLSMRQTTANGDITVLAMTGIIASAKVESMIDDSLKKNGATALKADCGPRVHPSHVGDKLSCDVRDGASVVAQATVVIKDDANTIDFNIPPIHTAPPAEPEHPPAPDRH